jgi:uncharacterized protein (TIGR02646 family)
MARVHGEILISRRKDISLESNYRNYRSSLEADFNYLCGYCGKSTDVSRRNFEIDHLVPISVDNSKINDYQNLVFCCFTCNRKKGKKWPTKDKSKYHDGEKGFIDPCSTEFDLHLGRDNSGKIIYHTSIGKYMHDVFGFEIRPTATVWKSMKLVERKKLITEIIESNKDIEKYKDFYELQTELDLLLNYLLGKGE